MKNRMKKLFALALAGTMTLSMAACGSGGNSEEAPAEGASAEESSGEGTTLRVLNWGSTVEETIANDAIARFNEDHPDVTVEQTCVPVTEWSDFIQKWITMSTSGEAPDVINLGLEAAQMAVENDLIQPLDDIVSGDEYLTQLKGEFAESLLTGFSVDGKLYGLPSGTQTMVMYFNKHMFDDAGIAYPEDGWTWDEFYDIAKQLTKDDGSVYGYGLASAFFQLTPWWTSNGAYLTDDDGNPTVNSEDMVESVEFLKKLVDEKITPDPISSDVYTMFSSSQLAMVGAGRWQLDAWQDAGLTNDDFDCVQWPVNKEESSVYGGSAWCLGKNPTNQDLAVDLLKEMVSEETMKATAAGGQQIPPTESLATDPEIMGTTPDNISGLWTAITISKPVCAPTYFGDLQTTFTRAMEEVFSGAQDPQAALDAAQSQVESAIG